MKFKKTIAALFAAAFLVVGASNGYAQSCNYPTSIDTLTERASGYNIQPADWNEIVCGLKAIQTKVGATGSENFLQDGDTDVIGKTEIDETDFILQSHATDCSSLGCVTADKGEPCFQVSTGEFYICDGSTWVLATGGGGSSIILDLLDDGTNESTALGEIAVTNDTNSIFSEPTADKLLIDVSQNWPGADVADEVTCVGCVADSELAQIYCQSGGTNCPALGTNVSLDFLDDDAVDSTAINEIAITNDTNSIFSEPTADKLLINLSQNWPTADNATTAGTASEVTCTGCVADSELATTYCQQGGTNCPSIGDMFKSTYDADTDNTVDDAEDVTCTGCVSNAEIAYPGHYYNINGTDSGRYLGVVFNSSDFTAVLNSSCVGGTVPGIGCSTNGDCTGSGVCTASARPTLSLAGTVYRVGDTIDKTDLPIEVARTDTSATMSSGITYDFSAASLNMPASASPTPTDAGDCVFDSTDKVLKCGDASTTRIIGETYIFYFGELAFRTFTTTIDYYGFNTYDSSGNAFFNSWVPFSMTCTDIYFRSSGGVTFGQTFNVDLYRSAGGSITCQAASTDSIKSCSGSLSFTAGNGANIRVATSSGTSNSILFGGYVVCHATDH